MRDYSKVGPQFWIGKTGKALRKHGLEAQLVGLYLMTSPHANMLGLYYVPKTFIAHETGLGMEGALKGLHGCIDAGFCLYDDDSEMVWVVEMARFQIADQLKDKDLRIKGVQNEYDSLTENPYLAAFFDMYADAFCMTSKRGDFARLEAPSKPLVSQEQEQEQEQEEIKPLVPGDAGDLLGDQQILRSAKPTCPHQEIIDLYHEILPQCPRVRDWTTSRQTHLRARWNEDLRRQNLDYWRRLFEYIETCDFLVGRSGKTPFFADLEWIVTSKNFTKIREEKYANRSPA